MIIKGIDYLFFLSFWPMRMTICDDLPFAIVPFVDFETPMNIHIIVKLTLFRFIWKAK